MNALRMGTARARKPLRPVVSRSRLLTGVAAVLVCAVATAATAAEKSFLRSKAGASRSLGSRDGMIENPRLDGAKTTFQLKGSGSKDAGPSSGAKKVCILIPVVKTRTYRQPVMDRNGRIHYEDQTFTIIVMQRHCFVPKE